MLEGVVECKRRIFWSLGQPTLKVGKAVLQPRIIFGESVHTQSNQLSGKQFGE